MRETENRMKALGLIDPMSILALDEWEIERECVVINRKIGEGAFGMVYGGESCLAVQGSEIWVSKWAIKHRKKLLILIIIQVAVAVKTLKEGSSMEEKIDFLGEADIMKRFDHKNIVKLLGVCTKKEPIYTVMEFMLYGDLKT